MAPSPHPHTCGVSTSPPEAGFAAPADPSSVPDAPAVSPSLEEPPVDPTAASPAAPAAGRKGLALASLILGSCAFVLGWAPFLGILLGATALVLGILALVKHQKKALAITGLSLGTLGLVASIVASAALGFVLANFAAIVAEVQGQSTAGSESGPEPSTVPSAEAPADAGVPVVPSPAADLTAFAETDAPTFAAIAADPDAHIGRQLVIYGEVAQFDDITGACGMLVGVSNAQQATWEGYQQLAVGVAGEASAGGEPVCPQLAGVANLSHVKLWVTVDGVYPVDLETGTENVPGFDIHQVEFLPALE